MQGRWLIDLLFPKLTLSTLTEALQVGISLPLRDNQTLRHCGVKGPHQSPPDVNEFTDGETQPWLTHAHSRCSLDKISCFFLLF